MATVGIYGHSWDLVELGSITRKPARGSSSLDVDLKNSRYTNVNADGVQHLPKEELFDSKRDQEFNWNALSFLLCPDSHNESVGLRCNHNLYVSYTLECIIKIVKLT